MNDQITLGEIAEVFSGYLFRRSVSDLKSGNMRVIQIKDLTPDNKINFDSIFNADLEILPDEKYLLKKDDIIFKTRSNHSFPAIRVTRTPIDFIKPTIATSQFFYIRLTDKNVSPDFITWQLNQFDAQGYFNTNAVGTALRAVSIETLKNFKFAVPSMQVQEKVIKLNSLLEQHQIQTSALQEQMNQMVSYTCKQAVSGKLKGAK